MDTNATQDAAINKIAMAARIVWTGHIIGVLVLGTAGVILRAMTARPVIPDIPVPLGVIRVAAYALGLAAIPASAFVKSLFFKKVPGATNAASAILSSLILAYSISEAPAFLALAVLAFGGPFADFYALLAISAVLLAYNFPHREQLATILRTEKTPPAIG